MARVYAQIQSGNVINTIEANPGDVFDPSFTWVDITDTIPQPDRGDTYDGNQFTYLSRPIGGQ